MNINDELNIILNIDKKKDKKKGKKRIITTTKKWNFTLEDIDNQNDIILKLYNSLLLNKDEIIYNKNFFSSSLFKNYNQHQKFIIQQIKQKLYSYKNQDQLKNIYNENNFINSIKYILKLLYDCNLKCFYCKNTVLLIYENAYEPKQWTLERINNNIGHNFDNICISCLKCNINRRTMLQKRYLFTKKCTNIIEFEGKKSIENNNSLYNSNILVILEDK